jgi:hypothetical protein
MREPRHGAGLFDEEIVHPRERDHRRPHEFDRDATLKPFLDRPRDDAHPTNAEHAGDAIHPGDERAGLDADVRERIA